MMKMVLNKSRVQTAEKFFSSVILNAVNESFHSKKYNKLKLTHGEREIAIWRAMNAVTVASSERLFKLYLK